MGEQTGISWTDHTFNYVIGCTKVSPGCKNCYAETLSKNRMGLDVWGKNANRKQMSEAYWKAPIKWNAAAETAGVRRRVFCSSMADVFEDHPETVAARERLWKLIKATPSLDWQLLTKRPENINRMLPEEWREGVPGNVWLGTSIETQEYAVRIDYLLRTPAPVHFVSAEPLLGPLNLNEHLSKGDVEWLIIGGESGPGCRPMDLDWARSLRQQCDSWGVFCWFKQVGGTKKIDGVAGGDLLDGELIHEVPPFYVATEWEGEDLKRSWTARDEHGCLVGLARPGRGLEAELRAWEKEGLKVELELDANIDFGAFGCQRKGVQQRLF